MKTFKNILLLVFTVNFLVFFGTLYGQQIQISPIPGRLKWFNDAKFGMFIHWGPYAGKVDDASWPVMLNQISEEEYAKFPQSFNPDKFNPDEWIKLAQEAGQRYMVFTAKHADGFCMFDSKLTDYKVTNTPFKKDVLDMLVKAARKERMPLGFYYCPVDFGHKDARKTFTPQDFALYEKGKDTIPMPQNPEWKLYLNYMNGQLKELLTNYGDVPLLWFDGLYNQQKYDPQRMYNTVKAIQPKTISNNRLGNLGDYQTPEQFIPEGIPTKTDGINLIGLAIENKENTKKLKLIPESPKDFQPWETCMTINCCWAYNQKLDYKSDTLLIKTLIEVASKGGNFLLNVGPKPDGTIPEEFVVRLRSIGKWLKVNGDAIYGTTYGPFQNLSFGKSTSKGKKIYLFVYDWSPVLEFPCSVKVYKASRTTGEKIKFSQANGNLKLSLSKKSSNGIASVIVLETR